MLLVEEFIVEDVDTEITLSDKEHVNHPISVNVSEVEQVVD